jgi:uncharacterized protein YprB with RNaseH-like and TPR domain
LLRQTFIHVPGIGKTTERALWNQGCTDWDAYLSSSGKFLTGSADRGAVRAFVQQSHFSLATLEHQFFSRNLGLREAWRAYDAFKHSCVYLDIETDGTSVTTIGMYDGSSFTCLLKGQSLENFRDEISRYSMIVTFCGGTFDIPILQKAFRGIIFDQIHVDLCPVLRKVGLRGGLKKIEKEVGIQRPPEVEGLSGFDAVILWRRFYGLGDEVALDKLIAYNREDCINLERLAEIAFEKMKEATLAPA